MKAIWKQSLKLVVLTGIVALVVAACGGSDPTAAPAAPAATKAPAAKPVATAVPPTAAPAGPSKGGVLNYPLLADLSHFDLAKGSYFHNWAFAANIYSSVVRFNPYPVRSDVVGDLADEWSFDGTGKILTLNFRDGVKWHDGVAFTSEDAAHALSLNAGRFASQFEIVEKYDSSDPSKLVIHLSVAKASFPSLLAHYRSAIFAKHVYDAAGGDLSGGPNVGTGPFVMGKADRGVSYKVERNDNYWNPDIPHLDGVEAFVVKEEGTRHALFRAGRLHVLGTSATTVNQEQADDLAKTVPDLQVVGFNGLNTAVLVVNAAKAPWDNVNLRRALSLAINRWEMAMLPHISKPAGPLVGPPGWGLSDEELFKLPGYGKGADYEKDLAEAKNLLAQEGYPDGIDVEMIGTITSYHKKTYEVLVDHFSRAGIRTTGGPVPSAEDIARRNEGTFELNVQGVGLGFPDPDGAVLAVVPGLFTKLEDPEMMDLFAAQSAASGDERVELVRQLQMRMYDQMNAVHIGWLEFFWVYQSDVRDLYTPLGWTDCEMDHVWLDPEG